MKNRATVTSASAMVILAAVNAVLVAPARAQGAAEDCGPRRDLALVNGRIYQMNAADAIATSVLIKNDKVVAIDPELNADDACIDTIDLQGRVVIPGLIDNHIHYVRIANRPGYDTRALETTFTVEAALAAIAERAADVPDGELITTIGGIRRTQWAEKRFPTLEKLNDAAPDHAVYLSERGARPGQTNTAGRDRLRGLGVVVGDDGAVTASHSA
jgi:predicted amidohydrolase YtcJ